MPHGTVEQSESLCGCLEVQGPGNAMWTMVTLVINVGSVELALALILMI